mmetsp:Transcript_8480/g.11660  ORF Transcript_8480/g.11660 Transcript_8480/m.11660 type:complete len:246 (+) Transcript_8480:55-792(+)
MVIVCILLILYLYLAVPPVPQDLKYHDFADKRCLCCKVPNTFDVLSNVPFMVVGLVSLAMQCAGLLNLQEESASVQMAWAFMFVSIVAIGFGSGYYHWAPSNATLIWDRLPMTFAFTSLTGIIIQEHAGVGLISMPFLVFAGIWSVWYWAKTDDLRPYAFIQGFPMLTLPFFLALFPARFNGREYYLFGLAWYGIARITEINDKEIFRWTARTVSGHTLKHLAAALALCVITRMLMVRHRIDEPV